MTDRKRLDLSDDEKKENIILELGRLEGFDKTCFEKYRETHIHSALRDCGIRLDAEHNMDIADYVCRNSIEVTPAEQAARFYLWGTRKKDSIYTSEWLLGIVDGDKRIKGTLRGFILEMSRVPRDLLTRFETPSECTLRDYEAIGNSFNLPDVMACICFYRIHNKREFDGIHRQMQRLYSGRIKDLVLREKGETIFSSFADHVADSRVNHIPDEVRFGMKCASCKTGTLVCLLFRREEKLNVARNQPQVLVASCRCGESVKVLMTPDTQGGCSFEIV